MNSLSRPLATLAAAAAGGAGLWLAGHWDQGTNGGYWAAMGVVAVVGVLLGLSQLRAPDTNAAGMLIFAWLPVTVVAGWVLVTAQPDVNTFWQSPRRVERATWASRARSCTCSRSPRCSRSAIGLVTGFTMLTAWALRRSRDVVVIEEPATAAQPVVADEHVVKTQTEGRSPARARAAARPLIASDAEGGGCGAAALSDGSGRCGAVGVQVNRRRRRGRCPRCGSARRRCGE